MRLSHRPLFLLALLAITLLLVQESLAIPQHKRVGRPAAPPKRSGGLARAAAVPKPPIRKKPAAAPKPRARAAPKPKARAAPKPSKNPRGGLRSGKGNPRPDTPPPPPPPPNSPVLHPKARGAVSRSASPKPKKNLQGARGVRSATPTPGPIPRPDTPPPPVPPNSPVLAPKARGVSVSSSSRSRGSPAAARGGGGPVVKSNQDPGDVSQVVIFPRPSNPEPTDD
ncbi:hypothetical protein HDU96_005431 [Phlyctochytrium bullatum]|nr:hypothetical protein HDU96_005431 [Phlyctochytrium bullatum]